MADGHMLELGRKILASQPFSAFLGAELLGLAEGAAELGVPIRPDRQAVGSGLTSDS